MKELKLDLEYCYGIKQLTYTFDFSENRTYAIYAQNGSMKTSLACTFEDYMLKKESRDRIYPDKVNKRVITDQDGNSLKPEQVFVIKSIDEEFRSDKESVLLANKSIRREYEDVYIDINKAKDPLVDGLKKHSGISKDIEKEISDAFYHVDNRFLDTMTRINGDVKDGKEPSFHNIEYKTIFNPKVLAIAKTDNFQTKLNSYVSKYDELLSKSMYLRKGVFNHYNAKTIATTLEKNGFFEAAHTVSLFELKGDSVEIKDKKQLEEVIQKELDSILTDVALVKAFEEIDKLLDGNAESRNFREFIANHKEVIPELKSLDGFRQKIWIDYIKNNIEVYDNLQEKYTKAKKDLEEISKKAEAESTKWSEVVREFNERFSVPFVVRIGNKEDVILRGDLPVVAFTFMDEEGKSVPVEKKALIDVLSQGEKKALYILNLIFEIEARKDQGIETVVIVDDIADSFDYKNKYAIVEYLKEIDESDIFFQIILTHNFDFFRTIENRFVSYNNCLYSDRQEKSIQLEKAQYIRHPFQHFMKNLDNEYMCLAIIPFIRNLIDYLRGMEDKQFQELTSVLHVKSDSGSITLNNLEVILKEWAPAYGIKIKDKSIVLSDLFIKKAEDLIKASTSMLLENKIILSVAIRLKAERFILSRIKDPKIIDKITSNQTQELFNIFAKEHPAETDALATLKKVNLITPQNIHINSFMYEPILDMSDVELKQLFSKVSELK